MVFACLLQECPEEQLRQLALLASARTAWWCQSLNSLMPQICQWQLCSTCSRQRVWNNCTCVDPIMVEEAQVVELQASKQDLKGTGMPQAAAKGCHVLVFVPCMAMQGSS